MTLNNNENFEKIFKNKHFSLTIFADNFSNNWQNNILILTKLGTFINIFFDRSFSVRIHYYRSYHYDQS